MLKSWSIQNFKPILDSGELKLAPVTVLAGRNSSGKSSLIQSILMVAQTLSSRVLDRPLLSHGPFVRLGTFADILNKYSGRSSLIIGFQLEVDSEEVIPNTKRNKYLVNSPVVGESGTSIKYVRVTSEFIGKESNKASNSYIEASKVDIERVFMEIISSSYEFHYDLIPDYDESSPGLVKGLVEGALTKREKPFAFKFNIGRMTDRGLEDFLRDVAPEFLRFVPYSLEETNYLGILQSEEQSVPNSSEETNSLGILPSKSQSAINDVPDPSLVAFSHFLPNRLITKSSSGKKYQNVISNDTLENNLIGGMPYMKKYESLEIMLNNLYVESIEQAVEQIGKFFTTKIRYLGPLRADPEILQSFPSSNEVDDIGSKGQYAATVYNTSQRAKIRWYDPINQKIEQSELKTALDTWARYLDVAHQIQTEMAGQSGVSWQIVHRDGHQPLPLSAVGVGISQILPILVMGLLAPSHTLLLVEQPELHLHPSVQARLGDFFLGLAKCNKQCLIETHSENLVNQLRYHIVQAGGQDKSDCLVYFVDQDELGAAKFEPIEISPQGNIVNWPEGFFDETILQEGRINTESLRKRAKKANNG